MRRGAASDEFAAQATNMKEKHGRSVYTAAATAAVI